MKSFFSIIYLPLKPDLQEKISVGLFLSDGENTFFEVSNPKLQVIKGLIPSHNFNLVRSYFNNIKDGIHPKNDPGKLNLDPRKPEWVSEAYFHYLARYSTNLVTYSEPRTLNLKADRENFIQLFEKFVFEYQTSDRNSKTEEDILSKVNTKLYSRIEGRVNLNVTLRPKDLRELITPVDVNFLGKNGRTVAGQTMDFSKRLYNLEHDLNNYISFTKAMDLVKQEVGHYFLVGQEPDKKTDPKNHRTWKNVRESHLVDYVDLEETERIREYIISKGVTPYFEEEAK